MSLEIKATDFSKTLEETFPESNGNFRLLAVSDYFSFENKEKKIGVKYSVADVESFTKLDVIVRNLFPIITNEDLKNNKGTKIFVTFKNSVVKPYEIQYGTIKCSVWADEIEVCRT